MEEKKQNVDIFLILGRCKKRISLFLKVGIITFIISILLIFPIPRYYECSVVLAPENAMGNEGALGSITSAIGMNLGGALSGDAIYPELYPQVLQSNDFIKKLINIPVETKDGAVKTTYFEYINKHQKSNILMFPFNWTKNAIKNIFSSKQTSGQEKEELNLFYLTKKQSDVFSSISNKIGCTNNIKTGAITITVEDQDPLICATIADSVRTKLQDFIIDYRTNKYRIDVNHYKALTSEAKQAYEIARQRYGHFSDSNTGVVMQSYKLKENDLENDMQLKFNTYSMLQNQLQLSQAKLQERTPAFTVIKGATVPQRPAGPKRMAFVITMLFIAMLGTSLYINKDLIMTAIRENP